MAWKSVTCDTFIYVETIWRSEQIAVKRVPDLTAAFAITTLSGAYIGHVRCKHNGTLTGSFDELGVKLTHIGYIASNMLRA